jgi:ATP-dependent helicase YprA (DUF1998 family)
MASAMDSCYMIPTESTNLVISKQCWLERAWLNTLKDFRYSSIQTCSKMKAKCLRLCRYKPHEWQLDVAEAMILKLDTVLIAGTSFGKTLPFVLPMMLEPPWGGKRVILIISPLIELINDHVRYYIHDTCVSTDNQVGKQVHGFGPLDRSFVQENFES